VFRFSLPEAEVRSSTSACRIVLVTMTEPLHSITCAALAQPVQHATSWWACL
jgi:hypothetical protein